MRVFLLLSICLIPILASSQIPSGFVLSKQWSKEISLYRAKAFVLKELLEPTNDVIRFQVTPVAASNSGEVTTLIYDCTQQNKFGLVLVFYGDYWNAAGVQYQGYGFKQIEKSNAKKILKKLESTIHENHKFLNENLDDFNVTYHEDDMTFLIYNISLSSTKIRIFWNGFDAEWDANSLYKTIKNLEAK